MRGLQACGLMGVMAGFALSLGSCADQPPKVDDFTVCSGGIERRIVAEANVRVQERKLRGTAGIDYASLMRGAIFADEKLSGEDKRYLYDRYVACLERRSASDQKLVITKALVLDESHLSRPLPANVYRFDQVAYRTNNSYEYGNGRAPRVALLVEAAGFQIRNGNQIDLEGAITFYRGKTVVAQGPIPGLTSPTEWSRRPVMEATGVEKVKTFLHYGDESLGGKVLVLIVVDSFRPQELAAGDVDLEIKLRDGIADRYATKVIHTQFAPQ